MSAQPDLFDILPHAPVSGLQPETRQTSQAAAERIEPTAHTLRAAVLRYTPPANQMVAEFAFDVDAAASIINHKCPVWYGERIDALALEAWASVPSSIWLNPPYSQCRAFIAKAAEQSRRGHTVVCLVPSRTDTRYWHEHIWDAECHQPRAGVSIRFLRGRLKFGTSANSAPFPSVLVIFRP